MQSPYHPYVVTFLLAPNLFAPQAMCVFYAPKDDMCVGVWVYMCICKVCVYIDDFTMTDANSYV